MFSSRKKNVAIKEYNFKIIVLGDTNTGKSTFIQRFIHGDNYKFSINYKPTIGVDFVTRRLSFDEEVLVQVHICDIAGQERFGGMTRVYYKGAIGCLILYDLTNYPSFESVKKWKTDLDNKIFLPNGNPIPCVLVGNKSDLDRDPRITDEAIDELTRNGFIASFLTSTKLNENVMDSMNCLIKQIIQNKKTQPRSDEAEDRLTDSIKLEENTAKSRLKCGTC